MNLLVSGRLRGISPIVLTGEQGLQGFLTLSVKEAIMNIQYY